MVPGSHLVGRAQKPSLGQSPRPGETHPLLVLRDPEELADGVFHEDPAGRGCVCGHGLMGMSTGLLVGTYRCPQRGVCDGLRAPGSPLAMTSSVSFAREPGRSVSAFLVRNHRLGEGKGLKCAELVQSLQPLGTGRPATC